MTEITIEKFSVSTNKIKEDIIRIWIDKSSSADSAAFKN
jgi:hypothetical protein